MKKTKDFPQLPNEIQVDVKKGESGRLLADLPKYNVFTEAKDLNHLFIQVNDLIYTYFDVPKKYQKHMWFLPTVNLQEQFLEGSFDKKSPIGTINISAFYTPELSRSLYA